MDLKMETRVANGITIIECKGKIHFGDEADALRDQLRQALKMGSEVILNFSGLSYIDSGGLGTLVGVYSASRSGGADIKLVGIGQRFRDVLQVTKLVTVFETYDTEQEAIDAFGSKGKSAGQG